MTVEIKQLVIRAVVEAPASARGPELRPATERPAETRGLEPVDLDAIVERCTREVLRTLERRRGR